MSKMKKMAKQTEKQTSEPNESLDPKSSTPSQDLCLTSDQLKTMALLEARVQMQYVVLENIQLKQDAASVEYRNKMAEFKAQKRATNNSLQAIREENNAFVAQVEAELGIELKDYSIEPDGHLTFNPLPEEAPPKEPPE